MNDEKKDQLKNLDDLYKRGVELRNQGERMKRRDKLTTLPVWFAEYEVWRGQVYDILALLSPGAAARFRTLNRIPERGLYRFWWALTKTHRRDLRTLERRLIILELVFDHYSGIAIRHINEDKE